jgi:metalloendopeptidase OMA1, mitochondrial
MLVWRGERRGDFASEWGEEWLMLVGRWLWGVGLRVAVDLAGCGARRYLGSMKRGMRWLPVWIGCSLVLLATCTTVPDTGRTALNFMGGSQLNQMGLSEFQKMKAQKPISQNAAYRAQLDRVASRLVRVIDLPGAQWEFVVFADPTPNAFALPGGKVGVNEGLFPLTQTDAGLAAVVGHEIGHLRANHAGERMSQAMVGGLAGAGLGVLAGQSGMSSTQRNVFLGAVGVGTAMGVTAFSRQHELEADHLGALYMARAGYDPRESIGVWIRMAEWRDRQGGARMPSLLSTHPVDSVRIANLERIMPEAMAEYQRGR